jgi:adenosylhomocysteine nucleosidase
MPGITKVGLLVALPDERRTLTNARIKSGRFSHLNENTMVCLSGVGPENASAAAISLIEQGCDALVSWGCAAALRPEFRPGDLLIPKQLLSVSGDSLNTDTVWRTSIVERLENGPKIHPDSITESSSLVTSAYEKKRLAARTKAAALDMESTAIVGTAIRHKVPAIVIRAIADTADMDLPKPVSLSLDDKGNVRLPLLIAGLIWNPSSIPGIARLARAFRRATKTLEYTARELHYDFSPALRPE